MEVAAMQAAARKLMVQQVAHPPAGGGMQQMGSVLGSVTAAPILALVVLVIMVAGRLGWLRRSSQKPGSGPAHSSVATDASCEGGATPADAAVHLADGDAACKSDEPAGNNSDSEEAAPPGHRPLLAGSFGWEVSPSFSAPVVGHIGGQEVRFGKLLSAGSISRVWRGSWGNTDVAVKVVHFDHTALTNPEQQLQQLVSLEHPHIVRTHCGVIHSCSRQGPGTASTPGSQQLHCLHVPSSDQQQHEAVQGAAKTPAHTTSNTSTSTDSAHNHRTADDQSVGPSAAPAAAAVSPVSTTPAAGMTSSSSSAAGGSSMRSGLLHQQLQQQKEGSRVPAFCNLAAEPEAEAWLVQELCDLGSLRSVALEWQVAGEGDLQMHERLTLLLGAARGLKYLHSRSVVHGDLSADNILVCSSSDSPVRMTAKVSDMGLCAAIKHASRGASRSVRSLSHVAPEVQRGGRAEPYSDVFAFGILMWEVFTCQQAYRKLLDAEHLYEAVVVQNLRPKIPEGMPRDYQLLLERCWASDPADRPPVDKLVGCLSVMAAERARRLNPHAHPPPSATPAAAVAVAAAAARGAHTGRVLSSSSLAHTHSFDQATLRAIAQQQAPQQLQLSGSVLGSSPAGGVNTNGSGLPVWRQGSGSGSNSSTLPGAGSGSSPTPGQSRLGPGTVPGRQASTHAAGSYSLLQQKSCPAAAFESLMRSRGALLGRSLDSDLSDRDQAGDEEGPRAAGRSAEAAFAEELQQEADMLLQLRASSLTQSGPGSVPVLHSRPHQRHMDGLDMWPPELDDAYMWHI